MSDLFIQNIQTLLRYNVPRFVKYIKDRGGVTNEEITWLTSEKEELGYPQYTLNCADEYIMFPKNEEVFKQGLFVLVKALALMSFVPGGVRCFNLHFDSDIEEYVKDD